MVNFDSNFNRFMCVSRAFGWPFICAKNIPNYRRCKLHIPNINLTGKKVVIVVHLANIKIEEFY